MLGENCKFGGEHLQQGDCRYLGRRLGVGCGSRSCEDFYATGYLDDVDPESSAHTKRHDYRKDIELGTPVEKQTFYSELISGRSTSNVATTLATTALKRPICYHSRRWEVPEIS